MPAGVDLFLGELTLLVCLSPLAGAVLVLLAGRTSASAARKAAVGSAVVTCLIAGFMLWQLQAAPFDADDPLPFQMVGRLSWGAPEGLPVALAVGVDGLSIWFVGLSAIVGLAAIVCGPHPTGRPAGFYALLLALQAASLLAFAALDAVLFLASLQAVFVLLFFVGGRYGGYERRTAMRRLLLCQAAGTMLVWFAILGCAAVHQEMRSYSGVPRPPLTFSMESLAFGEAGVPSIQQLVQTDTRTLRVWEYTRSWLFWPLVLGFAINCGFVPWHTALVPAVSQLPAGARLLFAGVLVKVGCYAWLRLLLPLFPELCLEHAAVLSWAAVGSTLYAALWTCAQSDADKIIAGWSMTSLGCAAAGLFSLNSLGMAGSALVLVHHGLAVIAAACFSAREAAGNSVLQEELSRLSANSSRGGLATAFVILALPGTAGFAGNVLIVFGMFAGSSEFSGSLVLPGTLAAALVILTAGMIRFAGQARNAGPRKLRGRISIPGAFAVGALVLTMALGLAPRFFLNRLEPSLSRLAAPSVLTHTTSGRGPIAVAETTETAGSIQPGSRK